jgi:mannose-6-phosphate isomerase-like protein (cupin superfamily)
MLIDGEIEVSFRGRTLHPQPGEEVLIPAATSHTVRNIGKTTNHWYYGYRLARSE